MALTIAQAVRKIIIREPFYGIFLLGLNKYFDDSIETACVRKRGINIELAINKTNGDSLDEETEVNELLHEVNHIIFKHLGMWNDFPNKERFNIAADCTVNSYLNNVPNDGYLPKDFGFENGKGTKGYYENLPNDIDIKQQFNHSWEDFKNLSDTEKQLLSNQIDYQVKSAAEEVIKTQGKLPGHLEEYIKSLFKKRDAIFNGKAYFRRMIGTIQDIELKKTRKKESLRFPDASGLKHKKKSNICVVVDTSGSVSNEELIDFFSEINYVGKAGTNITIIENDCTIQNISKYEGKWNGKVHGRGGTAFNDAIDGFNLRRKDYNTIIFFTDGYADIDLNIMGQSIGVITSEGKHQKYPGQTLYIPKK